MPIGTYNAGIGGLIWYPKTNKYLLLKRSIDKDFAPGALECVTGRVDQGEGFEQALHREVYEETGLKIEPVFLVGTTHFYRGKKRPENELIGLVYCCIPIDESGIIPPKTPQVRMSPEHEKYHWLTISQARSMISDNHSSEQWLLRVLDRAEYTKKHLPKKLIDLHRKSGFELDLE
jgi:8-oxo-dGTP pyrophosphatase MutT (NUDIX family)